MDDDIVNILKQQMAMLDISADLGMSEDDDAHIQREGTIRYVLDENIFEYLVSPHYQTSSQGGFYSNVWRNDRSFPVDLARSAEAQTSMQTAEWIISGTLPGASSNLLSMTDGHRDELARRAGEINAELKTDPRRQAEDLLERIKKKKALVHSILSGDTMSVPQGLTSQEAEQIASDCEALILGGVDRDVVDLHRKVSHCSALLVSDDIVEHIIQLRRLYSTKIYGRTISLEAACGLTDSVMDEILEDAREWSRMFRDELLLPGNRGRTRRERLPPTLESSSPSEDNEIGSIWNDAWAIAAVQKIADVNPDPKLRIVFVTGDQLLIDTYRRWYQKQPTEVPYILRRFTQYAPHFNPRDIGGAFGALRDSELASLNLFDSVQQAIGMSILPWLRTADREKLAAEYPEYSAQTFTLIQSEKPDFISDPAIRELIEEAQPDKHRLAADWASITNRWRKYQRIAVGSAAALVARRVDEHAAMMAKLESIDDTDTLKRFVDELLHEQSHESLRLWLPKAKKIIQKLRDIEKPRHIPALSLDDLSDTSLESNPAEVTFAAAACLSMEDGDSVEAMRFADIALKSDQGARDSQRGVDGFYPELLFLNAVTHRYGLANAGRHLITRMDSDTAVSSVMRSIQTVKKYYAVAKNALREALNLHITNTNSAVTETERAYHAVRQVRTYSERAALELFYATSVGLPLNSRSAILQPLELLREASVSASSAVNDLLICEQLFDTFSKEFRLNDSDRKILALSEMQFRINQVSVIVARKLLEGKFHNPFNHQSRELINLARRLASDFKISHNLAEMEFLGFEIWAGLREVKAARPALQTLTRANTGIRLDQFLFDRIRKRILHSERTDRR
ncbi:hypothetical protein [Asticcacaulis benevestitus]|uniref:Uncharacterized protein n=1 Tax=Asticcacaulis benevestitus DSM 16100 = ATCC BAA-896 TaxID=1121022 RepID=V4Q469_9CAUL|nr:hypothetical protein [Asticcacaulis benevestitus]ESQ92595.1 hypothetical protein ABENE_08130 [Asticcacaulis benevestitus DSM 16100 = ATCC BAA-896]